MDWITFGTVCAFAAVIALVYLLLYFLFFRFARAELKKVDAAWEEDAILLYVEAEALEYYLRIALAASGNKKVTTTPAHSINGINFADANAISNRSIEDYPIVTMSAQIDSEVHGEMTVAYYRPSVKVVEYQVDGDITVEPIAETGASVSSVDNLITGTASVTPLAWMPRKEDEVRDETFGRYDVVLT